MVSDPVDLMQSAALGLIIAILLWPWPARKSPPARPNGCRFCGGSAPESLGQTACVTCQARERNHRQRMATLAEKEARLRADLLLEQIAETRQHPDTTPEG
jgi:hypothetical protein